MLSPWEGTSGRPKFNTIRHLAKSLADLFFEELKQKEVSQYLILRGAYPFDFQYAIGGTPPFDRLLLPTSFIKLQRVLNPGRTRLDHPGAEPGRKLSGRYVAHPGPRPCFRFDHRFLFKECVSHCLPKQVYVFTACGSLEGIQRIYQECQKKGVELIPVFSQCIFEVSKTGNLPGLPLTDLSVMSEDSSTTEEFYEKARNRYQGKSMCCIGDMGRAFTSLSPIRSTHSERCRPSGSIPSKRPGTNGQMISRKERGGRRSGHFIPPLRLFQKNFGRIIRKDSWTRKQSLLLPSFYQCQETFQRP